MTEPPLPEIALTEEEVDDILHECGSDALLVGGQALAVWAHRYQVSTQTHAAATTSDVDFLGSAQTARELAEALKAKGWRFWQPSLDDATSQTAKLSKTIEGQGVKQIDFLSQLIGLDSDGVRRRAVHVRLADGTQLKVLHPLDVLESRLCNLASLSTKRNRQGVAQAQLAIEVVGRYLASLVDEGRTRQLLNAIERVARIAQSKRLDLVFHDYNLDPLAAVPVDRVPSEAFRARRWPRFREQVAAQRKAYSKRRRRAPDAEPSADT